MKYYFDTCIWMDYYEDRYDKFKPLGQWALDLINKASSEDDIILCSEFVVKELLKYFDKTVVFEIFEIVAKKDLLVFVKISPKQDEQARILAKTFKIGFGDCMHAILARDNNAILVTRDKHFELLKDIVEIRSPEELIF